MTYLYFSGVEGSTHKDSCWRGGARRWLASYWYLRKRIEWLDKVRKEYPGVRMMIDSGAHSLHVQDGGVSAKFLDDYVKEYSDWIWDNVDKAEAFVELDLADRPWKLEEWREEYFRPLEMAGVPIVYVWHPTEKDSSIQGWVDLCRNHGYTGISIDVENYSQILQIASKYLVKVHGFAMSAWSIFSKYPFYSVDSTSWKGGEMYGDAYVWLGNKMHRFKGAERRMKYRVYYERLGRDVSKMVGDNPKEISIANVQSFCLMEAAITKQRERREFGRYRLPPPEAVRSLPRKDLLRLPIRWWEGTEDRETPREDALMASSLQWGCYDEFRKLVRDNPDRATELFDEPGLDKANNSYLETLRMAENARTVASMSKEPLPRTSDADFEDVFAVREREDPLPVDEEEIPLLPGE